MRNVIGFVTQHENHFVQMVMRNSVQEQKQVSAAKQKKLSAAKHRIAELDVIFKRIYEDNISGKLSDDRFTKLSATYESEQEILRETASALEVELSQQAELAVNVERFVTLVRKHINVKELSPEFLNEMIDKIVVHAPDKSSGKRVQQIDIHYTFGIGVLDLASEAVSERADKKVHGKTA